MPGDNGAFFEKAAEDTLIVPLEAPHHETYNAFWPDSDGTVWAAGVAGPDVWGSVIDGTDSRLGGRARSQREHLVEVVPRAIGADLDHVADEVARSLGPPRQRRQLLQLDDAAAV